MNNVTPFRKMMKSSVRIVFVLLGLAGLSSLSLERVQGEDSPDEPKTLDQVQFDWEVQLEEIKKPVTDLQNSYQAQLEKLREAAQAVGNLKAVLAVDQELTSFRTSGTTEVDDSEQRELARLQGIYERAMKERLPAVNGQLKQAYTAYRNDLSGLITAYTQRNELNRAKQAQAALEGLKEESFSIGDPAPDGVRRRNIATLENSLGMKFAPVEITGGPSEGKDILFCVWETRNRDYEAFMRKTGTEKKKVSFDQKDDEPVIAVSWDGAKAFCAWLTKMEQEEGKLREGDVYRLPTDHEWSCAAGIGEAEDADESPEDKSDKIKGYPYGRHFPPKARDGNYHFQPEDGFERTAPVGSYSPNKFGLFDIGGNVMEMCEDTVERPGQSVLYFVSRDTPFAFGNPDQRDTVTESAAFFTSHRTFTSMEKDNNVWIGFRVVLELGER